MKILLTGASGFVGSHLLKKLLDFGFNVHGIDNFSSYYSVEYKKERLKNLRLELHKNVSMCDISNYDELKEVIADFKPNYVIHLAAQAGVRISPVNSDSYISANLVGFNNVVRVALESSVKGILYASSSSVYGDSTAFPYSESELDLKPKSIYAVTKVCNEMLAEVYSNSSALSFRGLRFFTVYGPWGRPDMAYFRLAASALGQGKFTLYGDGSIKRDFTYIDDVVNSTMELFQDLTRREDGFNDIVNIGGSRPLDINYLISLISRSQGIVLNFSKTIENQLDSIITMADNSYLMSIIGDIKFTDLEEGVENLMKWARSDSIKPFLLNWIQSTA